MRQLTVILCILACSPAFGQKVFRGTVSADAAAAMTDRSISIGFGHSFSEKFSAEGRVSVQIPETAGDLTEIEHEQLLSGKGKSEVRELRPELRMGMRYWPGKFSDGPFIGLQCSYGVEAGTDMVMECGYAVMIWKGLGAVVGYEVRVLEGIRSDIFDTKGLRIGINYSF